MPLGTTALEIRARRAPRLCQTVGWTEKWMESIVSQQSQFPGSDAKTTQRTNG